MLSDARVIAVLLAPDLDASAAFYTQRLGLPVEQRTENAVTLSAGQGTAIRLSASEEATKDTQTQLNLVVADVRAEVDALRANGVVFEEYDDDDMTTVDGVADMGDALVAWVKDPGGNVIGIEQPK